MAWSLGITVVLLIVVVFFLPIVLFVFLFVFLFVWLFSNAEIDGYRAISRVWVEASWTYCAHAQMVRFGAVVLLKTFRHAKITRGVGRQ